MLSPNQSTTTTGSSPTTLLDVAERLLQTRGFNGFSYADIATELDAYADLYADVLRGHRMCMCGMLAAEYQTLPQAMRAAVLAFVDENDLWLEKVLTRGRTERALDFGGSATDAARMIVDGLEGAMLVSRSYDDPSRSGAVARACWAASREVVTADVVPSGESRRPPGKRHGSGVRLT